MKRKITVLVGLVLMMVGLLWYAAAAQESALAAQAVQAVVPQLQQMITVLPETEKEPDPVPEQKQMTERVVAGRGYVGVLELPALSLKLPVLSSWSAENGKVAPCRYSGSVYQGDLIICAHNYSSHFGNLDRLETGDSVTFTDMDGNLYSYRVAQSQVLEGTDVDVIRDGDWDLTLFTCTPGGKNRYCLRCTRIEEASCQSG